MAIYATHSFNPLPRKLKWDKRFFELAFTVAEWSKDPSTKCGAVIVRPDNTIASVGFNGFARGVEDTEERYNTRETKLQLVLHAEENAILSAHEKLTGYTIYCNFMTCSSCAARIIQSGISRVVVPHMEVIPDRWKESFFLAEEQYREASVQLNRIIYDNGEIK